MNTTTKQFVHKRLQLKNIINNKPFCSDAEFTMPSDFSFNEKIEAIKLHSHDYIAFGRNHENQFLIEFLDYNTLAWQKQLKILIDIRAERFVSFLDNLNIVYFVILDPSTQILKFDEKTWSFQTYNVFDSPSQSSFINDQNIYFIRNSSIYCISLLSIFEDDHKIAPISELSNDFSTNENSEINENLKESQFKKYSFSVDYLDQKKIFATQQFSHYNLIYQNDDDYPLLIFDTATNTFCFKNELQLKSWYFKRKISAISPLIDAKFMQIPGKSNCFFLFHNFESTQNTLIPILQPLKINECQNENEESLIIIGVSCKRICPIIGMFSLPGEGFNFISVSSNNYYQFYKSCGLMSSINHSKSIINLQHQIKQVTEDKGKQQLNIISYVKKEEEKLKSSINESENATSKNKLIFINEFKKKCSQIHKEKDKISINHDDQYKNDIATKNNLDETSLISHPINDNQQNKEKMISLSSVKIQSEKQTKIQMNLHFLSLGPPPKMDIPQVEVDIEPEYHMIITTPIIPHCLFIKSVEIIVTCIEKNDILSFFLKPSACISPQKVEIKCSPDSNYKVKIKSFNGYQSAYSDTIEFTTPIAGIPPKVEAFFGSHISNDLYIFKWDSVPDGYSVKYYILEGLRETPTIQKPIDFNPGSDSNQPEDSTDHNQKILNDFLNIQAFNQEAINFLSNDNFEHIIDLSNDIEHNNICGAKLKISTPYTKFRIRASNSLGVGEPSDPFTIMKKDEISQKKVHKNSPRIGKDQVQYLSEFYESNPNPNFEERNRIASLLSLSYQTVNSWFARKRHSDKVNSKKSPKSDNQPIEDANYDLLV